MQLATDPLGFISIACGASEDFRDNETGLLYESDKKYIDEGEVHEATLDFGMGPLQPQVKYYRRFPQGARNCYTLKPKRGANNNYLVRAFFWYRISESKNPMPVFDLYLGANKWATVGNSTPIVDYPTPGVQFEEVIHFLSAEYMDVCLVKTGDGVPHISALELRPLDNSVYRVHDGALGLIWRADVVGGAKENLTRYPADVYDRSWFSSPQYLTHDNDTIPISTRSTIHSQSFDDAYKVPVEVLRTAVRTTNVGIPLNFTVSTQKGTSKCYVYFHFAEIEKFRDSRNRELRIYLNDEINLTESVRLEYLKPITIAPKDPPINCSTLLRFSIYAADGSSLPPILNAYEVFEFIELPLSTTNYNDVKAIMDIKQAYRVTRNWQGDPCLPSSFSWDGLNCTNEVTPRIISLNLSSSNLTGGITVSLRNLEAITMLDLSYNNLTGPLPEFLAQLPNLKVLNLTGNKLTGCIPCALREKSKDGTLLLSLDEEPDLCPSVPRHGKKKCIVLALVSIIVVLLILLAFGALAVFIRETRRERSAGSKEELSLKTKNRPFTYSEIVEVTNNFKDAIGEGGFGKVYLGTLKDDTQVAVKVLSPSSRQGYKEFQVEAQLLMIVHHRNLVSLIGYCDDQENKALIYEYMAHGNLRQHLLETDSNMLSWRDRLQIAVDAAHGLDYLHNGCKPPTIHRDLKPSNILLNENMQAKLSDFGLSRVVYKENDSHLASCPAGTPGYIDPEFYVSGTINKKSDVYSFGIILLELITGQPAIKKNLGNDRYIVQRVAPVIGSGDIQNLLDPRLQGQFSSSAAWKIVETALSCVLPPADQRPDISCVLAELKESLATEADPGRSC